MIFFGRDEATRTPDPYVPNVVRYQLRYIPNARKRMQSYYIFSRKNKFLVKNLQDSQKCTTFAPAINDGALAQLVEHRTENPCVPGSIPGGTTRNAHLPKGE